ncbi:methyltransferase domain-containing protein [Microbacterium sp. G2-8]|uniref:methyltransferase domain-containing protein n=1 Tax=Microbacterium sp. G2-8 TaxID=2842454 RepID=UPI001C8AA07F|nr:methyltransferase domain-containing protein [Microbacterium sp. G2-8]
MTLSVRAEELTELMDDPDADPDRLRRTLQRFDTVNRTVGCWRRVYRSHLRPVLARLDRPARILDIGSGGGDVLRRLVRRARSDGFVTTGVGIDPDPRALAVARAAEEVTGLEFREAWAGDFVAAGERFDVVVSNHLLHHLRGRELEGMLRDSSALAVGISVHSDIARGRLAYAGFSVGAAVVAPGTFLRVDGLRSIRRSFTPGELAARLPPDWRVERVNRFRLLAVHRAPYVDQ